MTTVDEYFNQAFQLHRAGNLAHAQAGYRHVLALQPDHADALHLLGVIASQGGRHDQGAELIRKAIAANASAPHYYGNLGLALFGLGQFNEAIVEYRKALALQPAYPDALLNLGDALSRLGRWDEAADIYRKALAIQPAFPAAYHKLGDALSAQRKWGEAIESYRRALALRSDNAATHCNLARALVQLRDCDQAMAHCRKALALRGDFAEAYATLGSACRFKGDLDGAIAAFEKALGLEPNFGEVLVNLASVLKALGRVPESLEYCRRAMELAPGEPSIHSNYVYTAIFCPDMDGAALFRDCRLYNQRHAEPLRALIAPHARDRTAKRPLRIGYVSPNFHSHSQVPFIYPLLRCHDRQSFRIYCYSDVSTPDAITAKLQSCADVWRNILGMSDQAAADLVRSDEIDILVDLTMHMADGRLLMFARKPAPVQVAWLAYPGTTGLDVMDYRFTDDYLDPPGSEAGCYAEESFRLGQTFACFDPAALETPLPVGPLPAQGNGFITFGCLNNFCKVNEGVLKTWAGAMVRVPRSRLRLLAPPGSARTRVLQSMEKLGIENARVDFVPQQPRPAYLAEFDRIDICLDTLPYNGHTTTLESLWAGVPVVSRIGATAAGRAGWSVLSNLGFPELAAHDDDQFAQIAADLPNDLPHLSQIRQSLRQRMADSPLTDAVRFAKNVEFAYRLMWHESLIREISSAAGRSPRSG